MSYRYVHQCFAIRPGITHTVVERYVSALRKLQYYECWWMYTKEFYSSTFQSNWRFTAVMKTQFHKLLNTCRESYSIYCHMVFIPCIVISTIIMCNYKYGSFLERLREKAVSLSRTMILVLIQTHSQFHPRAMTMARQTKWKKAVSFLACWTREWIR